MARVLEEDDTEAIQRLCELGVSEETLLRAGAAAKTVNRHFKRSGSRHTMNKGGRKMRWVSIWTPSAAHSVPHLHSRVRHSHIEPLAPCSRLASLHVPAQAALGRMESLSVRKAKDGQVAPAEEGQAK